MSDRFEERLREGLTRTADSITPDPQAWWRVQRRLRRRRMAVGGGALAMAGVAAAIVAVVVLPLGGDPVVEFAPPGVAESPAEPAVPVDPSATAVPAPAASDAGAILYTDGEAIHVADLQGDLLWTPVDEARGPITDVVARPGSTVDDFAVLYRVDPEGEDQDCGELYWLRVEGSEAVGAGTVDPSTSGTCTSAPVFADDGAAAAWLAPPSAGGDAALDVVDWDEEGPVTGSVQSAEVGLGSLVDPVPVQWTVAPDGGDTEGTGALSMRAVTTGGEEGLFTVPTVRTGDGALTVPPVDPAPDVITPPGGVDPLLDVAGGWFVGRSHPAAQDADDRDIVHGRFDAASIGGPPASTGLEALTWTPERPLSFDALGDTAIIAAGERILLTISDGIDALTWSPPLAQATSVALVAGAGPREEGTDPVDASDAPTAAPSATPGDEPTAAPTAPPSPTSEPTPTSTPTPIAPVEPEAVPPAVAATATARRQAALAGDWEALRAQLPADGRFTASFGFPDDPIAYYQQLQAEGTDVLGILADLLTQPHAVDDGEFHVWPRDYLEDGYLGWRVGIEADGTWRFFVAGD